MGRLRLVTKQFAQILEAVNLMTPPKETTIAELSAELHITRRSVFRLLETMEQDLRLPIEISRATFGGHAAYRLSESYVKKLSRLEFQFSVTFNQAMLLYLVFSDPLVKSLKIEGFVPASIEK
jgi:predicted DNA-binding transcriptional regulator YafY